MFGVNIWCIFIIITMAYLLYCRECRNVILEYEVSELKCKKDKLDDVDSKKIDNTSKKSSDLYDKMNAITQKNLGISLRDMVIGATS